MGTTAFCRYCDFRITRRTRVIATLALLRHAYRHRGGRPFGVWLFGRDSWRVPVQRAVCRVFGHSWVYPEQNRFIPKPSHCEVCTRTPRGNYLNRSEARGG